MEEPGINRGLQSNLYHFPVLEAILCGPTAVGKSALALRIARANGFSILSADSKQVYRGLEIGTSQPSPSEREQVEHQLVGFLSPCESYSHGRFASQVQQTLDKEREKKFLLVGGTGLYIKTLLYPAPASSPEAPPEIREAVRRKLSMGGGERAHAELLERDPEVARRIHPNDLYRLSKAWENLLFTGRSYLHYGHGAEMNPCVAGVPLIFLYDRRESLYARIDSRVCSMVEAGWLQETASLLEANPTADWPCFSALGYAELAQVVQGRLSLKDAIAIIQKKTRNFAKKQGTFFRHQFPGILSVSVERFAAYCESVEWRWERIRKGLIELADAPSPPAKNPT